MEIQGMYLQNNGSSNAKATNKLVAQLDKKEKRSEKESRIKYRPDLLETLILSEEEGLIEGPDQQNETIHRLANSKLWEELSLMLESISHEQRMIIALYLGLGEGTESNDPRNISQLFDMIINLKLDKDPDVASQEQLWRNKYRGADISGKAWFQNIEKHSRGRLEGTIQSPKEKLHYMLSPRIYPLLFSKIKQDDTGAYTFEGGSDTIKSKRLEESIIKLSEEERSFIISSFEEYKDIEYIVSPEVYPLLGSKIAQLQKNKSFNFDTFCNNTEFPPHNYSIH